MPSFVDERKVFKVWNDGDIVARGEAAAPHFLRVTSRRVIFLRLFLNRGWNFFLRLSGHLHLIVECHQERLVGGELPRVSDST